MGIKKVNNNNLKWKAVAVEGTLAGGDDFEGFAGLEVLENYDSSIIAGGNKRKRRDFAISELDGDILTGSSSGSGSAKRKKEESDDEEEDESVKEEKPQKKKKKVKGKSATNEYPGKYVLLKQLDELEENFFASPENAAIRSVRKLLKTFYLIKHVYLF